MKFVYGIIISLGISLLSSYLFPNFTPHMEAVSTLYTVAGIMFSIGMSIIITFNTNGVKNKDYKILIRKKLHFVQNNFIITFIIISILYIILSNFINNNCKQELSANNFLTTFSSQFIIITIILAIIYFIANFKAIDKLNNDLRDHIDENENN